MNRLISRILAVAFVLPSTAAFGTQVLVPLSLGGSVATQSSDFGGGAYPAGNAIDGNLGNFTHTEVPETNATWTLTLPSNLDFDVVRIWNRGDGCCQGRLRDLTVNVFSDASATTNIFTSATLNPGNALNGPRLITLDAGSNLNGRVLKISRAAFDPITHDGSVLSLGEVQLFDRQDVALPLGTNLTQAGIIGLSVAQSSEYEGGSFPANLAVDNNAGNFTHTRGDDANAFWSLNFGEIMRLQTINLHNRGDGCCQGRLQDIVVTVFDQSNTPVFTSSVLNPGNSLSNPSDILLDIQSLNGGNPIFGQSVRVSRLGTAPGTFNHDANVLSLGEVTVVGGSIPEPASMACLGVGSVALLTVRRRSRA